MLSESARAAIDTLGRLGWTARASDAPTPLPAAIDERYPDIPSSVRAFLEHIEECARGGEQVWFLTSGDYAGTSGSEFAWNAWESLESEDADTAEAADIARSGTRICRSCCRSKATTRISRCASTNRPRIMAASCRAIRRSFARRARSANRSMSSWSRSKARARNAGRRACRAHHASARPEMAEEPAGERPPPPRRVRSPDGTASAPGACSKAIASRWSWSEACPGRCGPGRIGRKSCRR